MKRLLSIVALFLFLSILSGCTTDKAIAKGYIEKYEYFDPDGIQDFTDYCKYIYQEDADDTFKKSTLYREMSQEDVSRIAGYFDNFAGWAKAAEHLQGKYDFDPSLISAGDYYDIQTKEGTPVGDSAYGMYDDYSVYYYDTETHTLFYIHNNI
ncbi:MAG TPA: hypothetical protein PK854_07110 [Oscillospiraceae bacterium]|nr:hypothetical protein [Oscillospiraceae bacterium]HPS35017.1 hypothetical protein [Oscillospiraceae bacterium]